MNYTLHSYGKKTCEGLRTTSESTIRKPIGNETDRTDFHIFSLLNGMCNLIDLIYINHKRLKKHISYKIFRKTVERHGFS